MSYDNYYQNELKKIDRSVSRMFLVLTITLSSLIMMTTAYYMLKMRSEEELSNINYVNTKVDTVLVNQSSISNDLDNISHKLDESLENNEMVMDSIVTLKNGVNRINYSVGKVSKNIDTIVLYIKK
jgi:hypothetical protein